MDTYETGESFFIIFFILIFFTYSKLNPDSRTEDGNSSDISPVPMSTSVDDRSGQPDETTIERGNPLFKEIFGGGRGDAETFSRDFSRMHMISKKDLSEAEMDTLTKSCSPTIVITANGEVQTQEEAIVYVKDFDIFLTMKVLENTPAVLSLGKLCDENGYSYEWINGQKPHLIKNGKQIICNTENFVPIVVPCLSSSSSGSSSTSRTPMKQESHSSSSSSSSPSSPTVDEIPVREREDATNSDISPVPVSNSVDDRSGQRRPSQQNPKTIKKETTTARGDPLCSDDSEIPEWL